MIARARHPSTPLACREPVRNVLLKYNKSPILREVALALTPKVFVMWDERYQAFVTKYQTVSFRTTARDAAYGRGR